MTFIIILLAFGGLWLSTYIYLTERSGKPLVCPLDGSCDFVVHSGYSIILGIPVYVLGIFYYTAIILLSLGTIFLSPYFYTLAALTEVILSTFGFLMSLYFTWLQLGIIKRWCTLCIGSALISTAVFVLALYGFWPVVGTFLSL